MSESKVTVPAAQKKLRVINLIGAPGAGKSTLMADIFAMMKRDGHQVEQIPEHAKELVWRDRQKELADQLHITGEQHHRLFTMIGKVDYVITDSPILLGVLYLQDWLPREPFLQVIKAHLDLYENVWIYVNRVRPYDPHGRVQSESESEQVDKDLKALLEELGIKPFYVDGDDGGRYVVRAHLKNQGLLTFEENGVLLTTGENNEEQ